MRREAWFFGLVLLCAGCHRDARRIRSEYQALFTQPHPALRIAQPAPDAQLTVEAANFLREVEDKTPIRERYDTPLPQALQARLLQTDLLGPSAAFERITLEGDHRATSAILNRGVYATLLFDKAKLLLPTSLEAAYDHAAAALELYGHHQIGAYIHEFSPAYFLNRLAMMLEVKPPASRRERLARAAAASVMNRAELCDGMREELLEQAGLNFWGYLTPMRDAFVERWGDELAPLLDSKDYARRNRPPLSGWLAFRKLYGVVTASCGGPASLDAARATWDAPLADLRAADANLASLLQVALDRTHDFDRVVEAAKVIPRIGSGGAENAAPPAAASP